MPRKGPVTPREVAPDVVFDSEVVARFINRVMIDGKKRTAERIFYGAMQQIHERTGSNPTEIFQRAISNVMPALEVRPRRIGGATYQVPMEVSPRRQLTLGIRWLVTAARNRGERTMMERLTNELIDASNHEGGAMHRRDEMHRMAEANKAYAHYRW